MLEPATATEIAQKPKKVKKGEGRPQSAEQKATQSHPGHGFFDRAKHEEEWKDRRDTVVQRMPIILNKETEVKPARKKKTWEVIGHIAVDAGMLWISDPCRVFGRNHYGVPSADGKLIFDNWFDFLERIGTGKMAKLLKRFEAQHANGTGQAILEPTEGEDMDDEHEQVVPFALPGIWGNLGLAIFTRFGDGYYAVEGKRDQAGMIEEIRIKL